MSKKTYTATGYIEWVANINVGSASFQVPFTGGAVTKYGTVPAEYTTSDPVIQKIIEESCHFKNKRIVLYKEEKDPEKTEAQQVKGPVPMTMNCMADAMQLLHENFGIPTAKIQSREDIKRIGLQHNIKFIGL